MFFLFISQNSRVAASRPQTQTPLLHVAGFTRLDHPRFHIFPEKCGGAQLQETSDRQQRDAQLEGNRQSAYLRHSVVTGHQQVH